jgi:hypothetical protein
VFPTGGGSGKGMPIDSKGNAWITNTAGSGLTLETMLCAFEISAEEKAVGVSANEPPKAL